MSRQNEIYIDPIVKLFDLRTMRSFTQIQFDQGPFLTRFHPVFSSSLLVVSQVGLFQRYELHGASYSADTFQLNNHETAVTCASISPSGECTLFGDSGGLIHLWLDSHNQSPKVNSYSRATPPLTLNVASSIPLLTSCTIS